MIESLPPQLFNESNEDCFTSALGIALANFDMLGDLSLKDILQIWDKEGATGRVVDGLKWLQQQGLNIEVVDATLRDWPGELNKLRDAGISTIFEPPTCEKIRDYLKSDAGVIIPINNDPFTNGPDSKSNHVFFISDFKDGYFLVLDPSNMTPLSLSDKQLELYWGKEPTLFVVTKPND